MKLPSRMNRSTAAYTAGVDGQGRRRFVAYRVWHWATGYRSFKTLALALAYARLDDKVIARIERFVITVLWNHPLRLPGESVHDEFATLEHVYLSTACYHEEHSRCEEPQRLREVRDGRVSSTPHCEYCPAECICECHRKKSENDDSMVQVVAKAA